MTKNTAFGLPKSTLTNVYEFMFKNSYLALSGGLHGIIISEIDIDLAGHDPELIN
jgi:hypothetical protein